MGQRGLVESGKTHGPGHRPPSVSTCPPSLSVSVGEVRQSLRFRDFVDFQVSPGSDGTPVCRFRRRNLSSTSFLILSETLDTSTNHRTLPLLPCHFEYITLLSVMNLNTTPLGTHDPYTILLRNLGVGLVTKSPSDSQNFVIPNS